MNEESKEEMPYVCKYNHIRGFGFIQEPKTQSRLFFHISNVLNIKEIEEPRLYDKISSYEVGKTRDGRHQAVRVVISRSDDSNATHE